MGSLLSELGKKEAWEKFYGHKTSGICAPSAERELREFIDKAEYMEVCREIADCLEGKSSFPLPRRAVISKMSTQKKRTVYIYPRRETVTLKLLTYLVLRKYDDIFADNLYSFRPDRSAHTAIHSIVRSMSGFEKGFYSYKVDISDYFNSIDISLLLPELEKILSDDPLLYKFLSSLLCEKEFTSSGVPMTGAKGIMAGTPIACFYANIFLKELDFHFEKLGIPYARYSDDIIVLAESREELSEHESYIRDYLRSRGLKVNPAKESRTVPGGMLVFLGFATDGKTIDIAPATVTKLKGKMRRKARALVRWAARNDIDPANAAKAFIRIFNRKLLDVSDDHDLTWSRWFFSVINTDKSLRVIDGYAQDTIRYIAGNTRRKSRYNIRYEDLKKWGYRSLVAEYYAFGSKPQPTEQQKD